MKSLPTSAPATTELRPANLFSGISALPSAFSLLIRSPALLKWAIPPILLSLALVFFGFSWVKGLIDAWVLASVSQSLGGWLAAHPSVSSLVHGFLQFFTWAITLIAGTLVFTWAYVLLAIPFSDPLAEATERRLGMHPENQVGYRPLSMMAMFLIDLRKSLIVLVIQMGLLMFSLLFFWVPGIHFVLFFFTAWLLAFQFLSYPQTRRGIGFFGSISILRRKPIVVWSFGACIAFVYFIPYVASFLTPVAVIAGTILYARLDPGERWPAR